MSKKIIGDYDSSNTFTVYHTKSNNGEDKFRIGATDNGCFFENIILLIGMVKIAFYVIISPYLVYKYFKEKSEDKKMLKKYLNCNNKGS